MQVSANLNQKIAQAVQTSMQIEGCKPVQSDAVKKQAQALMEQHSVQVSVRRIVTSTCPAPTFPRTIWE